MMYMEEEVKEWVKVVGDVKDNNSGIVYCDSNGVVFEVGDSVVFIKDLKVKGSSMVVK